MVKKLEPHPLKKIISKSLIKLPTPPSISYLWNWGSMLGLTMMIQVISGILLASHYNSDIKNAFESIVHISRDINYGFELRFIHMNTASFFFIFIFIHISRGLYMSSFKLTYTWASGITILLVLMATAFLGYVLPWGQMSFWGATVITNLLSALPLVGNTLVLWIWGGFSINTATLTRFFMLHFTLPFILMFLIITHLSSLHLTGSNNPMGLKANNDKIPFNPFFSIKDLILMFMFLGGMVSTSFIYPFLMGDPENFNLANPLNTPLHIQPEWYFLFAYAILRSIPNKLGGVMALAASILMISSLIFTKKTKSAKKWMPNFKSNFWLFSASFMMLTWAGAMPVESPYENISKMLSVMYFSMMFTG